MARSLLLTGVELDQTRRADVRVTGGTITELGVLKRAPGEREIAGQGHALLAGLHDHHCHVLATAAALVSVDCGPPAVTDSRELASALHSARPVDEWIRGVGYDDAVAGALDRVALDRLSPAAPTRIQHRSGALWIVNTLGADRLGLERARASGVERDGSGRVTGRLWRLDAWLRDRIGGAAPEVATVSSLLAARGVTGVTDATPDLATEALQTLVDGGFAQRLVSLGQPHHRAVLGPRKLVLPDHALPPLDGLLDELRATRPRAVAIHCVTREALALALAALAEAGPRSGDRVEHAAVCPPELARRIAALGVAVVTQPSLVARRGDDYLARVDRDDLPYLWPFASLLAAGVRVGCSSDAPYGDLDPWASVAAAVERRAPSGRLVTPAERVDARTALDGYLAAPSAPGGQPRQVTVGGPADLCLLDRPIEQALAQPRDVEVRLTLIGGEVAHDVGGVLA